MSEYIDAHCGSGTGAPSHLVDAEETRFIIPDDTRSNGMAIGELFHYLNWIRADDDLDSLRAKIPWAKWEPAGPVGGRSFVGDLSSMRQYGATFAISDGDDPRVHAVSLTIGFNNFLEFEKTMRSVCAYGHLVSDPPYYLVAASVARGQTGFEVEHSWWQSVGHLYEVRGEIQSSAIKPTDDAEVICVLTVTKYFLS
jgi:hypothetical protein